jgi:hypothetical protein
MVLVIKYIYLMEAITMKKLFTLSILILSLLFSSQAYASNQTTVHTTIDYVYYDSNDHMYYANTVHDNDGGYWTINIEESAKLNSVELNKLNKQYKSKPIKIVYTGNLDTDSDIEILSSNIIN